MIRARTLALSIAIATSAVVLPAARAAAQDAQVESDAKEKSRAAFRRGVAQLRAQDWHAARASFEQAYALFPHPSILLNLGIARLKTNDPVLAEQDLVKFLSEDIGASADELNGARESLAEARSKIGTVRVIVSPASARVSVDGRRADVLKRGGDDAVAAEVRTKPGRHVVVVEAEGFTTERRDVDVAAKGESEIKIALKEGESKNPPPPPPPPKPPDDGTRTILGWSCVGLAGAAVVSGAAFGLVAKGKADDYNDKSSSHYQDSDTRSTGTTMRTLADVSFGVAILSGAAAAILLLTDIGASSGGAGSSPAQRFAKEGRPALLRW